VDRTIPSNVTSFIEGACTGIRAQDQALRTLGSKGTYPKYLVGAGPRELTAFFEDFARVDLAWVAGHRRAMHEGDGTGPVDDLRPVDPGRVTGPDREELEVAGRASLEAGHWSVLVFSGGAATRFFAGADTHPKARELVDRLGYAPPKGLFPVTPVMGFSFLEMFAAQGLAAGIGSGRMPCLILMTSHLTDDAVRRWARTAPLWGHPRDCLLILPQAEHPRLDADGDLLALPDGHLLFTGDGHGGVFRALLEPGEKGRTMASRLSDAGVRHLVLHNVDNGAANGLDEARIGYHVRGNHQLTLSVVQRTRPDEPVGLVALNGRTGLLECVEYSVCPKELSEALAPDGNPRFSLAHICTNLVDLAAVRADLKPTLYTGKEVQVGDRRVASSTWEMLNQDLSRHLDADRVGVIQVGRDGFFLPTKSLAGSDSLESTMAALAARDAARLTGAGARVHENAHVEIDPCLGPGSHPLRGAGVGWRVARDASVYLGVRHGPDGSLPFTEGLDVGEAAVFRVSARRPYGSLAFDPDTRAIGEDPPSAGRLSLGRHVSVGPGVAVDLSVEGDGCLVVPDGTRLERDVTLVVPPGETKALS